MPIVPIGIWQNKRRGSEREIMCFWKGKGTAISVRSLGCVLALSSQVFHLQVSMQLSTPPPFFLPTGY